ncbi:MAG: hypothetical protein QMB62_07235, partial [Oscillospiraceae bacterium]
TQRNERGVLYLGQHGDKKQEMPFIRLYKYKGYSIFAFIKRALSFTKSENKRIVVCRQADQG